MDLVSAAGTGILWSDTEEGSHKKYLKRRISYREESPRKRVCTSPRLLESCGSPQLSKLKRQASSDRESPREKACRLRSRSKIPTESQPHSGMNELYGLSSAPGVEEKEEKEPDSPNELEFLRRPVNLIDLYHRENRIRGSWTILKTWEIPCTNLGHDYLLKDCCNEDLLHLSVALCDWGAARFTENHTFSKISPPLFRSPEVLIGAPWTKKKDIWMLGCVIFALIRDFLLFSGEATRFNEYNRFVHLHEICKTFGPFPKSFLAQARDQRLIREVFDNEGTVNSIEIGLRPEEMWFGEWLMDESWEECMSFISMFKNIMKIDPAERSSAAELLEEPWLRHVEL